MNSDLQYEISAGIAGGVAASLVMMAAMMAGKRTGIIETPLPVKVERQVERGGGIAERTGPQQERAIGMLGHIGVGAAFGAGYGALHAVLDQPALPAGPLYGLGVYALNLVGIGPLTGLTAGPWHEAPMTVGRRVMMHAVYGAVTAVVAERVREALH